MKEYEVSFREVRTATVKVRAIDEESAESIVMKGSADFKYAMYDNEEIIAVDDCIEVINEQ